MLKKNATSCLLAVTALLAVAPRIGNAFDVLQQIHDLIARQNNASISETDAMRTLRTIVRQRALEQTSTLHFEPVGHIPWTSDTFFIGNTPYTLAHDAFQKITIGKRVESAGPLPADFYGDPIYNPVYSVESSGLRITGGTVHMCVYGGSRQRCNQAVPNRPNQSLIGTYVYTHGIWHRESSLPTNRTDGHASITLNGKLLRFKDNEVQEFRQGSNPWVTIAALQSAVKSVVLFENMLYAFDGSGEKAYLSEDGTDWHLQEITGIDADIHLFDAGIMHGSIVIAARRAGEVRDTLFVWPGAQNESQRQQFATFATDTLNECEDTLDNDGDLLKDEQDPACSGPGDNKEYGPPYGAFIIVDNGTTGFSMTGGGALPHSGQRYGTQAVALTSLSVSRQPTFPNQERTVLRWAFPRLKASTYEVWISQPVQNGSAPIQIITPAARTTIRYGNNPQQINFGASNGQPQTWVKLGRVTVRDQEWVAIEMSNEFKQSNQPGALYIYGDAVLLAQVIESEDDLPVTTQITEQAAQTVLQQLTVPACRDGWDNDVDGQYDSEDAGCRGSDDTEEGDDLLPPDASGKIDNVSTIPDGTVVPLGETVIGAFRLHSQHSIELTGLDFMLRAANVKLQSNSIKLVASSSPDVINCEAAYSDGAPILTKSFPTHLQAEQEYRIVCPMIWLAHRRSIEAGGDLTLTLSANIEQARVDSNKSSYMILFMTDFNNLRAISMNHGQLSDINSNISFINHDRNDTQEHVFPTLQSAPIFSTRFGSDTNLPYVQQPSVTGCYDSDGPSGYTTAGSTSNLSHNGDLRHIVPLFADVCASEIKPLSGNSEEKILLEGKCENNRGTFTYYACPGRCENGRCVSQ